VHVRNQAFKIRDEHLPPCGASQPVSAYALTEGASGAIRGKKAMRAMLEWPDWEGGEIDPDIKRILNPSPRPPRPCAGVPLEDLGNPSPPFISHSATD
jgi:hypothetical protein